MTTKENKTDLTSFLEGERKGFDEDVPEMQETTHVKPRYLNDSKVKQWLTAHDNRLLEWVREMVLQSLPPERIIHTYVESQNTPENNAWNEYRNEAIATINRLLILTPQEKPTEETKKDSPST